MRAWHTKCLHCGEMGNRTRNPEASGRNGMPGILLSRPRVTARDWSGTSTRPPARSLRRWRRRGRDPRDAAASDVKPGPPGRVGASQRQPLAEAWRRVLEPRWGPRTCRVRAAGTVSRSHGPGFGRNVMPSTSHHGSSTGWEPKTGRTRGHGARADRPGKRSVPGMAFCHREISCAGTHPSRPRHGTRPANHGDSARASHSVMAKGRRQSRRGSRLTGG
jgi:hypothetical protein